MATQPGIRCGRLFAAVTRSLVGLLLVSLPAGCDFGGRYQQRLDDSKRFYEYAARVNLALGPSEDELGAYNIAIRPPMRFKFRKQSLKPFSGKKLPGLVGSWQSELNDAKTGKPSRGKARMFVFSNWERFLSQEENEGRPVQLGKPSDFHTDFVEDLARAIDKSAPGPGGWKALRGPEGNAFVDPKDYTEIDFSDTRYRVYLFPGVAKANVDDENPGSPDQLQVVLLWVIPANTEDKESLNSAIDRCLELFALTGGAPASQALGGGGAGGGQRGGGGSDF